MLTNTPKVNHIKVYDGCSDISYIYIISTDDDPIVQIEIFCGVSLR